MIFKEYKNINEKLYIKKIENGLTIKILPKKNFKKKYVSLCVNYGAKDTKFIINEEKIVTPVGVAHFLEHLMFQMENGVDASNVLAKYGAESNAYTSYEKTVYYFSTIINLEKNIGFLLDFVQTFNCSEEDVNQEKGIIEQEIKMSLDDSEDNLITEVVKNLYEQGFINEEIVGTLDSIKKIDLDILKKVFLSFYRPENMEILILGDVNKDKILEVIECNQLKKKFTKEKVFRIEEEYNYKLCPYKTEGIKYMDVSTPKVAVAFKHASFQCHLLDEYTLKIILKIIFLNAFSITSNNYQKMMDLKIINSPIDINTFFIENYNFTIMSVDSNNPNELIKYLYNAINDLGKGKIDFETFEIYKKGFIGSEIRRLASLRSIAYGLTSKCFKKVDFFENLEKLKRLKVETIEKLVKEINVNIMTSFIIAPENKAKMDT